MNDEKRSERMADELGRNDPPDGAADMNEARALWRALAAWPEEAPSERSRSRFYAMLEGFQEGRRGRAANGGWRAWLAGFAWPRLAVQTALAAVLLAFGFWLGGRGATRAPEGRPMSAELDGMARRASLALMRHQSPGERLAGVAWTYRLDETEPRIVEALLEIVRADENVNVRLAAVDALTAYRDAPRARQGLIQALGYQSSPLVQIALIDALVGIEEKGAVRGLRDLLTAQQIDPAVRRRAELGVAELQ